MGRPFFVYSNTAAGTMLTFDLSLASAEEAGAAGLAVESGVESWGSVCTSGCGSIVAASGLEPGRDLPLGFRDPEKASLDRLKQRSRTDRQGTGGWEPLPKLTDGLSRDQEPFLRRWDDSAAGRSFLLRSREARSGCDSPLRGHLVGGSRFNSMRRRGATDRGHPSIGARLAR